MNRVRNFSFFFISCTLLLIGGLKLGTPVLTVLFSTLLLRWLTLFRRKWVAVIIFLVVVIAVFQGFILFVKSAFSALPEVAHRAIPLVAQYVHDQGFELPFSDVESLKGYAVDSIADELGYLTNFAKIATKEFAYLIIGFVVAISLFLRKTVNLGDTDHPVPNDLYTASAKAIIDRFTIFYQCFERVIGAQLIISAINTTLTGIFVLWVSLPYSMVVVVVTFICGLLPVVGNLVSNTVIVAIGITVSPKLAVAALIFLVAIHKLEYFLNSKIIGTRIKNPMWLTLLGLILGEHLMGIPGMILAPVILSYIKVEASQISLVPPAIDQGMEKSACCSPAEERPEADTH